MRVRVQDITTDPPQTPHTFDTGRAEPAQAVFGERTIDGWSILLSDEQVVGLEVGITGGMYFFPNTDWTVEVIEP